jgi:hypothetical protein
MVGRIDSMFASSVAAAPRWFVALGKVLLVVSVIGTGAGCGQKGPLTLPAPASAASGPSR